MAFFFPYYDPIAIHFGFVQITWYALSYIVGVLLSISYIKYIDNNSVFCGKQGEDFLLYIVLGIILGGRLGYVLFYDLSSYLESPIEILKVWNGGMSFHGGVIGISVAVILISRKQEVPILWIADLVAVSTPIGIFLGRIANFINGELFGRYSSNCFAVIVPHIDYLPRHPSQLYEALMEGVMLFVIMAYMVFITKVREKHGIITGVFFILYAICRIIMEIFREPDMQIGYILQYFTMGQILSLFMIIIGCIILYCSQRNCTKMKHII